jgi:tRNA(Arg) A34 adenosine deaminase TadA
MEYLQYCIQELHKSDMHHRHGAVIVAKGGKIVASHNFNSPKKTTTKSIHAEVAVIEKFKERYPKRFLRECFLVVARMNKREEMGNSKPCKACQKYIIRHDIPTVYYSM